MTIDLPYSPTVCFTPSHSSFVSNVSKILEPSTYAQASKDAKWIASMHLELLALEQNHSWVLTELAKGKRARDCEWVYKVKCKLNGEIERLKARSQRL